MMLAIKLTLLLFLGLLCIGLLMMVVTQLTQRYFLGLAAGCLFLFGSYFGLFISGPPSWTVILPSVHLTYTTLIPVRSLPLGNSYLYWGVWIAGLALIGRPAQPETGPPRQLGIGITRIISHFLGVFIMKSNQPMTVIAKGIVKQFR